MSEQLGRRGFLKGVAAGSAGLAVVAFDPTSRSWITEAHASTCGLNVPALDGELVCDAASLEEAADDFGHMVHRSPTAVLRPGSVADIQRMVRYARRHHLEVAMRGQGHATNGQAQVDGGIVIDSRTLDTIHHVGQHTAVVDAGVTWRAVLDSALAQGLTPPALTDYVDLSIGGTLSVGGIGGHAVRVGMQIDNVKQLWVVDGWGRLIRCSRFRRRGLFDSVLGGLGQYGIIVKAEIDLVPAPTSARVYRLVYSDIQEYVAVQQLLADDERFDYLEGQVIPADNGGWMFMVEAAAYFDSPGAPDDAALLSGLGGDAPATIEDMTYEAWQLRLDPIIQFLKSIGVWEFPHPWVDLFLPSDAAASFVGGVLETLTLDDTGQGPVLFYPFKKDKLTHPLFRVPDQPILFLFDILRTAPPIPGVPEGMKAANRALFEQARAVGGTHYPIGSIDLDHQDWVQHYGPLWPLVVLQKLRFDPARTLAPGQGIF